MKQFFLIIILICLLPSLLFADDSFEPDNSFETAKTIFLTLLTNPVDYTASSPVNYTTIQHHYFSDATDEDWVKFYVNEGEWYLLEAIPVTTSECDLAIGIYLSDGQTIIKNGVSDSGSTGIKEEIEWEASESGLHYARIYQAASTPTFGEQNAYKLIFSKPGAGAGVGYVTGKISPCTEKVNFSNTRITITHNNRIYREAKLLPECYYFMTNEAGDFKLNVRVNCFNPYTQNINVKESAFNPYDVSLAPVIDFNNNCTLDLGDLIILLQHFTH
jgi:hypothetical protein